MCWTVYDRISCNLSVLTTIATNTIVFILPSQCNVADDKGALAVVKGNDRVMTVEM